MSFYSCQTENNKVQGQSQSSTEPGDPFREINRIICAAPSVTEFVYALGLGHKVIGVSDFSTYPAEAKEKDRVGGLINPNREKIIALEPDLLILQGKNDSIARLCQEHKIRFLAIEINSVEDIWNAIRLIGEKLNVSDGADRLVSRLRSELQSMQKLIGHRPTRRVFLTLGHTPGDLTGLMTAGPKTFIHELVSLAGGENVFHDALGMYPQISKESLIKRQPEVIIEAIPGGIAEEKLKLLRKDWSQLPMLPAVQSGQIHFLTEDFLLIPGTRIAQTVQRFAQIIHPEAFGDHDDA
jgi:iron complex transport system substrate-binding protein